MEDEDSVIEVEEDVSLIEVEEPLVFSSSCSSGSMLLGRRTDGVEWI